MKKNAPKLGIDPEQMVSSGGSAGGHLAACMMIEDRLIGLADPYWQKAEKLGVRAERYIAEGKGHGFFNKTPWRERTLIAADKFLASLGLLEGTPALKEPIVAAAAQTNEIQRSSIRNGCKISS